MGLHKRESTVKKFTRWIGARFIKNHQNINNLKVRAGYGMLEGWTSVVGNTLLFAVKITAGLYFSSIALIADAVHTLADSATSVVIIMGFKMARKPSDREHPFGHGFLQHFRMGKRAGETLIIQKPHPCKILNDG